MFEMNEEFILLITDKPPIVPYLSIVNSHRFPYILQQINKTILQFYSIKGMNVQTKAYEGFLPDVRMHKEKRTLFYNGEILYEKKKGFLI